VNVHGSALRHGIDPKDSVYAATHAIWIVDLDENSPHRQLRLGFDPSGRMLETVVLTFDSGNELVIHAMKARPQMIELLP